MCKTEAGRKKVTESLKGIENSIRQMEREQPISKPLDMMWMWKKLGIER